MIRTILGTIVGVVAAFATVWLTDLLGHLVYPIPSGLRVNDYQAIGAYIRSMPPLALAFVALSWFLGALVGALVAGTLTRRRGPLWLVAALVAVGGLLNIFFIPHPLILQIGAVAAPALGGWVADRLLARRAAAPAAAEVDV